MLKMTSSDMSGHEDEILTMHQTTLFCKLGLHCVCNLWLHSAVYNCPVIRKCKVQNCLEW